MNHFCHKCGKKLEDTERYCAECGTSVVIEKPIKDTSAQKNVNEKWWFRFAKVVYIILYLPLLAVIPIVWSINSSEYVGYGINGSVYNDTPAKAFLYSLLALAIYVVIARLIKITFLYITFGQKPEWQKEFSKPF